MSILRVLCASLVLAALMAVVPGHADTLPTPTERIVLRVDGHIERVNLGNVAVFDMQMLKALGSETFASKTEWTDGTHTFTGVPLKALVAQLGATGTELIATAADGYAISIPMADLDRYTLLLVYAIDGKLLDLNDKGPLWIMYRWDQMTAGQIEDKSPNAVWQLQQLTFE